MGQDWNEMTEPMSLEDYVAQADRRIRASAHKSASDLRHISLPYINEGKPAGVDWDFIEEREGKRRLDGYVPTDKEGRNVIGNSGVTVASGFDLGQHGPADLKAMNLYQGLIDKLTPYMGPDLRRKAAQEYLAKNPLRITDEQARMIDERAQQKAYDDLARRYNAQTVSIYGKNAPRFQDLPRGAQTAISSVAFQYGNLATETPNFWRQVTSGQWQEAYDNLRDFKDAHGERRQKEAGLLGGDIRSGLLPAPPQKSVRR